MRQLFMEQTLIFLASKAKQDDEGWHAELSMANAIGASSRANASWSGP